MTISVQPFNGQFRLYVTGLFGTNPAGPRLHHADPWPQKDRYRFTFDDQAEAMREAGKIQAYLDKPQLVGVLKAGGTVLHFGWNTVGMGTGLGFCIEEILLVCHGSDHNDTICLAERHHLAPTAHTLAPANKDGPGH